MTGTDNGVDAIIAVEPDVQDPAPHVSKHQSDIELRRETGTSMTGIEHDFGDSLLRTPSIREEPSNMQIDEPDVKNTILNTRM